MFYFFKEISVKGKWEHFGSFTTTKPDLFDMIEGAAWSGLPRGATVPVQVYFNFVRPKNVRTVETQELLELTKLVPTEMADLHEWPFDFIDFLEFDEDRNALKNEYGIDNFRLIVWSD